MRCLIPLLLAAILPVSSRADDSDKAPSGDLGRIQGVWTAMVGPNADIPITVEFKQRKVSLKGNLNGNDFVLEGEVKIDESKTPKTLDWIKFVSPQGDEVPDNRAIYKLEGDSLTVCSGGPGNDRPSEFKKGDGGQPNLVTFKRSKADEKPKQECGEPLDAPKGDLAKLAGEWETKVGPEKDRSIVVEFKGTAVSAKIARDNGSEATYKGEAVVNESATPKTIDLVKFKGDDGEEVGDNLGVYKIEGDTFTLCVGGPGNARPSDFKAGEGEDGPRLWVFTRKK